nr:zinc finger protein sens isoform X6 [Crassostrea gigas]
MNYQKVYMNQIYSSSIMRQVAQMWKNQLLCDAVIKTGNTQTKAHRLVLIAACPMLQHMENASVGSHLEVRLNSDIKQNSINTFLQYLYEGYMMLTEENCKDVEKIAKLLHADSVAKCCVDFQKCLNAKSGMSSYEGANFEVQDSVEFRYVCSTDIQKTVQDGAMKRSSESSGRPPSPGSKRARVQSGGPGMMGRVDDRFSMAHSYTQDPFERVPRLGSGYQQPKPQPGVIEILEDTIEMVTSEPPERDPDGWPRKSDRPPIQKSMSISVAGQVKGGDSDLQIIDVSSLSVPSQSKPSNTSRVRSDSTNDRPSTSYDISQPGRSTQRQSPYSSDQSQSPRTEVDGSFQRQQQQFSQSAAAKQTQPRAAPHPSHPPQLKHMSMSGVQNSQKSFAAGNPSQASFAAGSASQVSFTGVSSSQSNSPQIPPTPASTTAMSPRNVAETTPTLPSPTKSLTEASRRPQTVVIDQPPTDNAQQGQQAQEQLAHKSQEKDPVNQKSIEMHAEDVERLLAASEPVASQSGNTGEKSKEPVADLTVIKIEEEDEEDTGGLDMYVDVPDDSKQPLNLGSRDDSTEQSEIEDPPGDWSREDFSNESGSFGADPNISWQDASFNKGLAIHNGSKSSQPFQGMSCRNCGAWFVDEKQFLHHMAVIENQSVCAICRECGKYFISADGFKFHMKMNHGSAEECPECNVCGKRFQTKHHLRRHMTMHSTAKPFSCSICGTRFKRKDHLQKHVICTHHKSPS